MLMKTEHQDYCIFVQIFKYETYIIINQLAAIYYPEHSHR